MWLDEDPAAIAKARSYARRWSGTNGLDGERARELELIVSELVTNAIQHGSPPYRIDLKRSGDSLHGEVSDGSRAHNRDGSLTPTSAADSAYE